MNENHVGIELVDLVVKGGILVTSSYMVRATIVIDNGKIVSICSDGATSDAERVIDAAGLHVLPGIIDGHVHFREPGLTYKEDFGSGSIGAAAGGVTFVIDMPNVNPPTSDPVSLKQKVELASSKSYVDFGIIGVILPTNLNQITSLAEAGVIGYKIFMGETIGGLPSPNDGEIIEAFQRVAKTGLRVGVHAENRAIIDHLTKKLKNEGRIDPLAHLESRPAIAEAEAVQRAILFEKPFRTKLHIYHMSSKEAVEIVRRAKHDGLPVSCETCPHYLLLDGVEGLTKLGSLLKMNPPVRTKEHGEALWRGLKDGTVDAIATDHSPHTREEKLKPNIWEAIAGFPGVETLVPLMLTQVNDGRLSLTELVKVMCENPARLWGVYPKKGTIRVGSDGDLTIIDLREESVIKAENLHSKSKLTPFDGFKVKGMPVYTIVRGNIMMEHGEIVGKPKGEWVRPIPEEV